ncbi:MAG: tRNA 2-thiouridine(34) synthase MnmA [bacterium]
MQKKERVLVAMSGGVDSSVAAALLKDQGYEVIGVTMQIWPTYAEASAGKPSSQGCCSLSAVEDARRVADKLGIPHYVLNYQDLFYDKVICNFIAEYKNGRTPNPCVRCNEHIKFDALIKKADEMDAQYLATGHYARIKYENLNTKSETNPKSQISNNKQFMLLKGKDPGKDQSYFLYMLNQVNLSRILFPMGGYLKEDTRKLAEKYGLAVADKVDSQEICFVNEDNYGSFIEKHVPGSCRSGEIVDQNGKVYGGHRGITNYTVGQRRGLGVSYKKPLYVIKIDVEKNQVVVGEEEDTYGEELLAKDISWVGAQDLVTRFQLPGSRCQKINAKIRYATPEYQAKLLPLEKGKVRVVFDEPVKAITPGQAVVFYDGDEVLGGGTIE